jgi:hypothetical protein
MANRIHSISFDISSNEKLAQKGFEADASPIWTVSIYDDGSVQIEGGLIRSPKWICGDDEVFLLSEDKNDAFLFALSTTDEVDRLFSFCEKRNSNTMQEIVLLPPFMRFLSAVRPLIEARGIAGAMVEPENDDGGRLEKWKKGP